MKYIVLIYLVSSYLSFYPNEVIQDVKFCETKECVIDHMDENHIKNGGSKDDLVFEYTKVRVFNLEEKKEVLFKKKITSYEWVDEVYSQDFERFDRKLHKLYNNK